MHLQGVSVLHRDTRLHPLQLQASGVQHQHQHGLLDGRRGTLTKIRCCNMGLFLCVCSYEYTWRVAAFDLYEGLGTVSNLFVGTTLTALADLQQLHTYLLIASIIVFVGLVFFILLPFKKRLVMESIKLAGLLSQLPQVGLHLHSCARQD